jgi:hypothetical protein
MSTIRLGLALLVVLAGKQALAHDGCEVETLAAARAYVNCFTLTKSKTIRHGANPDPARCDARLERRLARADCSSAAEAAALGSRLQAALVSDPGTSAAMVGDAAYTPVVISVLADPNPVVDSDGRRHLVYELFMTNASPGDWPIEAIEVLDGNDPEQVLLTVEGDQVAAKVQSVADGSPQNAVLADRSAVAFLHVPIEPEEPVPARLVHRVTLGLPDGLPDSFRLFAGISPESDVLEEVGAVTTVARRAPAVLGPPLVGGRWVAADGCCEAPRHVRALQSVNGELLGAQRFAIDWEMINEEDRIFVGDPQALESYLAYGQPVLAVADGRIARVLDGLEEQVPGALPAAIALADADGNHVVLDLGDGRFVLYAHLIPDSIEVVEGQQVRRGDVLGLLGNSGNTLAPHLHLHVMSTPSGLASNGLPCVFDGYELLARVPSTEAFDHAEATGEPLEMVPVDAPGTHIEDLPLDQSVVIFPGD